MSDFLKKLAQETLSIMNDGYYRNPNNQKVNISFDLLLAVQNSKLYDPTYFTATKKFRAKSIKVVNQSVLDTAYDMIVSQKLPNVSCLNFASAYHEGGGWLSGTMAQEESICYASGLYQTLLAQPQYYKDNIAFKSGLFTDNIIYSPQVPIFRDNNHQYLHQYYNLDIVTSPAVKVSSLTWDEKQKITHVMEKRMDKVFQVFQDTNAKNLILGAWGCGIFGNEPIDIANMFNDQLSNPDDDAYEFNEVVFAVYDRSGRMYDTFEQILLQKKVLQKKRSMVRRIME